MLQVNCPNCTEPLDVVDFGVRPFLGYRYALEGPDGRLTNTCHGCEAEVFDKEIAEGLVLAEDGILA